MFGQDIAEARVRWSGYYVQDRQRVDMSIDNVTMDLNGNIFATGGDEVGEFALKGRVHSSGMFSMDKEYLGQHTVKYTGTVKQGELAGKWNLAGMSDVFSLQFQTEEWNGSFEMDNQKYPMRIRIYVDDSGVFGLGKDSEGVYIAKGRYDKSQHMLTFIKSYLGKYSIEFIGNMYNDGSYLIVSGAFRLSTGQTGNFEIYRPVPQDGDRMALFYAPPPPPQDFAPVFFGMAPNMVPQQYHTQPHMQATYGFGAPQMPPMPQMPQMPQMYQQAPPMQVYPQYQNPGQLTGYLEDLDFIDGDKDDIMRIVDKLYRGKKILGKHIASFVPMIKSQEGLTYFCQNLNQQRVEQFDCDQLIKAIRGCKFHDGLKMVGLTLFPLLTKQPSVIDKENFVDCFVFKKDKDEIVQKLKIYG